jgi:hypothetical protein
MTMADLTAQKTLVKSPPELWSELSEVESLAKHLGELGEIRITKVEPESTVAWEGEEVSGTVELEQSGWGTKVTFKATVPEPGPAVEAEAIEVEPEPEPDPPAEIQERKQGFLARWLFRRRQPEPAVEPEPVAIEPEPPAEPAPEPVATAETEHVQRVLEGTLEALGQAHHRPFSRG